MSNFIKQHWPHLISLSLALLFIAYALGCEPRARSPLDPTQKLTRAELQVQMEYLINQFDLRLHDIDKQEQLRNFILQNALAIGQAGTVNPLSILTTIAAFYGVGSAGNAVRKGVKKITPIPKSPSA